MSPTPRLAKIGRFEIGSYVNIIFLGANMGSSRLSVTLPTELFNEIKQISLEKKIKLSHLVADAIREKTQLMKEEALLQKLNQAFEDDEIRTEQSHLAEIIADNTDIEELPW